MPIFRGGETSQDLLGKADKKMRPRLGIPKPGPICGSNWRTSKSRRWLPVRASIPKLFEIVEESCRMVDRYPGIPREVGTQEDNPPVIRQVSPPRWLVNSYITRPPPFQNVLFRYCRSQSRRLRGFARPVALRRRNPICDMVTFPAKKTSQIFQAPLFFRERATDNPSTKAFVDIPGVPRRTRDPKSSSRVPKRPFVPARLLVCTDFTSRVSDDLYENCDFVT